MKRFELEPGLLSVFRLFTGLRLVLSLLSFLSHLVFRNIPGAPIDSIAWLSCLEAAFLLGYLSWRGFQNRLGRMYLPIGLFIASAGPIIEQHLITQSQFEIGIAGPVISAWQLIPILFVPLVLIGWQYNFRSIVLFCMVTALFDGSLAMMVLTNPDSRLLLFAGVLFTRTVSFILVGYMVVRLMNTQREQRKSLAQANTRLIHYAATLEQLATSHERNRLARELHDTLAHSLSGVAVQLEAVKTLWETSPGEAHSMLEQSLRTTRLGLTETRRALQALRASPLEDLGLTLALCNLAESVTARSGLTLDLNLAEHLENLSPDIEQCIYRVAQEALENVASHAEARHVRVDLRQEDSHLSLTISDDGQGFEPERVDLLNQFGLRGMRERAEGLGGTLKIDSQPGTGTTISLEWGGKP